MAIYQGPFATSNTSGQTTDAIAGQRPENWREGFLRLYPTTQKNAPLAALTAKMKSKELTDDPVFHWFEKDIPTFVVYVNNGAGYAAGATTIAIDDGAGTGMAYRLRAGHQVRVERTGEIMWVTTNPANATDIVVVRGMGSTAAAALSDNDVLTVLGTVHGEHSDVPIAVNHVGLPFSNVAQIFREPFTLSGTAQATKLRTGEPYKEKRQDALEAYNMQLELAFWFSQMQQTSGQIVGGTGQPERSTGGIFEYIVTNAMDASAGAGGLPGAGAANTVTMDEFENALELLFRYGGNEKLGFAGSGALLVLQKLQRLNSSIQIQPGNDVFGLGITKWLTPFGTLNLINHPLFSVHPTHRYTLGVLDINKLRYRYMKGRDTSLLKNRQGNGVDGITDEFLGECGLEVQHEKTHGYIMNMQNAA